ncbi:peptide chain release factor N(5)-glutamine methyltransferase [Mycoplasmopsis lipophila]|uniref:peptide chain release factor N(5)-glutamine methyltransferase n=1 Tax=Mycoplasmopsis lipophila TaxID=2117 RepID=UPI0038730E12
MATKDELLLEKRRYGLEETISPEELEKLSLGYPIQKIMGYIESDNIKIKLDRKVLIPRYETMELVDIIKNNYLKNNIKVLDICCGSGYIGLALKKHNPSIEVYASDIDEESILSTQENAILNNLKINIYKSDLFEKIPKIKFDLIISNPPYLDKSDILDKSVLNFEPHNALFAKENGFFFYKKILQKYSNFLKKNGYIFFEINPIHSEIWKKIKNAQILKDINNKNRFVIIKN